MSAQNPIYGAKRLNVDLLAKSLERLSIYDGQGKSKLLKIPTKVDFEKILGNLDLEKIDFRMSAYKQRTQGTRSRRLCPRRHRLC